MLKGSGEYPLRGLQHWVLLELKRTLTIELNQVNICFTFQQVLYSVTLWIDKFSWFIQLFFQSAHTILFTKTVHNYMNYYICTFMCKDWSHLCTADVMNACCLTVILEDKTWITLGRLDFSVYHFLNWNNIPFGLVGRFSLIKVAFQISNG